MKTTTVGKLANLGILAASVLPACGGIAGDYSGTNESAGVAKSSQAVRAVDDGADQQRLKSALPTARVHTQGGRITRLEGAAMARGRSPEAAVTAFIENAAPSLGVTAAELEPLRLEAGRGVPVQSPEAIPVMFDPETGQYRARLYRYGQVKSGIVVLGAQLLVLVRDAPDYPVVWARSSLRSLGDFSVKPGKTPRPVDPSAAMRALQSPSGARGALVRRAASLSRFSEPEWVIFAGLGDETTLPRLATRFRGDGDGLEESWQFIADAETGEILRADSLVAHASVAGSVRGNATVGYSAAECSNEASVPLAWAAVTTPSGASGYTGPLGNFYLPNAGASPVTVTSPLRGLRFNVTDRQGPLETLTMTVTPPARADFLHNEANSDPLVRAQVNAYVVATAERDYVLRYHPNYPTIPNERDFQINVNVDCGDDVPATVGTYRGWERAIFLCRPDSANVYSNMGFGTPVLHEYGHHIVGAGGGYDPWVQDEYGEGMADALAALVSQDPLMVRGIRAAECDSYVRSAENDCQYTESGCSSCGNEIHACGQVLSGIIWDIRKALQSSHPADYQDIISRLTIESILLRKAAGGITPEIAADFLEVDRESYGNHTAEPHRAEICAGFAAHGIECPPLGANPCAAYCGDPLDFTWSGSYQSGALGTGRVCRQTSQRVVGGNCGNMANGRKLYVNGTEMTCNNLNWKTIPAPVNDGYCVHTDAGETASAFFTLW
jgi:hypothetical protein